MKARRWSREEMASLECSHRYNWKRYARGNHKPRLLPMANSSSSMVKGCKDVVPTLQLGPTIEDARIALSAFLRSRQWLRTSPEAQLQVVRVPCNLQHINKSPKPGGLGRCTSVNAAPLGHSSNSLSRSSNPSDVDSLTASFYLLRDDLLHPVLGGNKVRKLDALVPELLQEGTTDVVTCGGVQSAHLAAVAVVAAEAGLRSHLLIRGEPPQVPAGYHLVTRMYGTEVSYVSRAEYAERQEMLESHSARVRAVHPGTKLAVIAEGGGEPPALLGLLRLVHWLAYGPTESGSSRDQETNSETTKLHACSTGEDQALGQSGTNHRISTVQRLPYPSTTPYKLVVDSGTGTAAIGLALGIALLGLPWSVHAVMLAGDQSYYCSQQEHLVRSFLERYGEKLFGDNPNSTIQGRRTAVQCNEPLTASAVPPGAPTTTSRAANVAVAEKMSSEVAESGLSKPLSSGLVALSGASLPLLWLPRPVPRRFGKVLPGDIAACQRIAQMYGVGLDPIYSLAAWEVASSAAAADVAAVTVMTEVPAATATDCTHWQDSLGRGPEDGVGSEESSSSGRSGGGGATAQVSGSGPVELRGFPVVLIHGGGALGLHGLAQRYPANF